MSAPELRILRLVYLPGRHEVDSETTWQPQIGAGHWYDFSAYRVVALEDTDPPEVHLERDEQLTRDYYRGLPESTSIVARYSVLTSDWSADVYESGPGSEVLGSAYRRPDCFTAVEEARSMAVRRINGK